VLALDLSSTDSTAVTEFIHRPIGINPNTEPSACLVAHIPIA
jgi:hypothetical protein